MTEIVALFFFLAVFLIVYRLLGVIQAYLIDKE